MILAHPAGTGDIGPIGTASRVVVGLLLLYLALADGPPFTDELSWDLRWQDAVLGLVVFPGVTIALGLVARRRGTESVHFDGALGIALNCLVIVVLVANPYTAVGALLFYGTTLLIAAWRGEAGCEATAISNWILGRADQIGCPTFSPLDAAETRMRRRRASPHRAPV